MYIYIYIYIYRERERESEIHTYIAFSRGSCCKPGFLARTCAAVGSGTTWAKTRRSGSVRLTCVHIICIIYNNIYIYI